MVAWLGVPRENSTWEGFIIAIFLLNTALKDALEKLDKLKKYFVSEFNEDECS